MKEECNVEELKGKILKSIDRIDDEELIFVTINNEIYKMYHDQDCCENVYIEDINGNLDDLIGSPILIAEGVTNQDGEPEPEDVDSWTWTFYKFATIKGYVTIRWLGESNGYYSESISFYKIN